MGGLKVKLASLTAEGRILLTLKHGKHTYSELRLETGLSDRWLTVKLEELEGEGIVEKMGKWYGLRKELDASSYELSLYMRFQAERMAGKLAKLGFVRTVVLFGGVAQGKAHQYSDLDMIIVVNKSVDTVKKEIMLEISKLELMYHVTVEPLILAEEDFLDNVYSPEAGIIYGVAEGFKVLTNKTGEFTRILNDRVEEIRRSREYLEEARIWLKLTSSHPEGWGVPDS
jgi:predicted nucleotidyltransferase